MLLQYKMHGETSLNLHFWNNKCLEFHVEKTIQNCNAICSSALLQVIIYLIESAFSNGGTKKNQILRCTGFTKCWQRNYKFCEINYSPLSKFQLATYLYRRHLVLEGPRKKPIFKRGNNISKLMLNIHETVNTNVRKSLA